MPPPTLRPSREPPGRARGSDSFAAGRDAAAGAQALQRAARADTRLRQFRPGAGMLPPALRPAREPPGRARGAASSARCPGCRRGRSGAPESRQGRHSGPLSCGRVVCGRAAPLFFAAGRNYPRPRFFCRRKCPCLSGPPGGPPAAKKRGGEYLRRVCVSETKRARAIFLPCVYANAFKSG